MAKPYIANIEPLIQAGIDPNTGLPVKLGAGMGTYLKTDIKRMIGIMDYQDSINRFEWDGLPEGIDGKLIERLLYYKGQVIIFKMEDDRFYVLPYTLSGSIDCYGRWRQVTPIQVGSDEDTPWINGLIKTPVYDMTDEINPDDACIIIHDYSPGLSNTIISRNIINQGIIDVESDCIPFMRTSLISGTGVLGIRVGTEGESDAVLQASRAVDNAALTGNKYVPIIGGLDFQSLASNGLAKAEEYMLALQSLDNFRLQSIGVTNGGVFSKKAHELQDEANMNSNPSTLTMQDAISCRQSACDLINQVFGLNVTVKQSEAMEQEQEEDTTMEQEDTEDDAL